jgi:acid phosphatase type 7
MFIAICILVGCGRALAASPAGPPRFEVPVPHGALTFVVYGDTRFTGLEGVANAPARRALVGKIAAEDPAAILIGGDLIYQGDSTDDYATYRTETLEWTRRRIPVFPALGNHEYRGCNDPGDDSVCLQNWWLAFPELHLRPHRWYSVSIGPSILALILDSDQALTAGSEQRAWLERQIATAGPRCKFILIVLHYPPVRDPVFPHGKDEAEVESYLSANAGSLRARVVVIGSHVHNYERFSRNGVMSLVSGGGGAKPVPAFRMSGELSQLTTAVNFHYLRFTLDNGRLTCTMVRFEPGDESGNPWSEPDRFEVTAQ